MAQPSVKARSIEVHTHESRIRSLSVEVAQKSLSIEAQKVCHGAIVRRRCSPRARMACISSAMPVKYANPETQWHRAYLHLRDAPPHQPRMNLPHPKIPFVLTESSARSRRRSTAPFWSLRLWPSGFHPMASRGQSTTWMRGSVECLRCRFITSQAVMAKPSVATIWNSCLTYAFGTRTSSTTPTCRESCRSLLFSSPFFAALTSP